MPPRREGGSSSLQRAQRAQARNYTAWLLKQASKTAHTPRRHVPCSPLRKQKQASTLHSQAPTTTHAHERKQARSAAPVRRPSFPGRVARGHGRWAIAPDGRRPQGRPLQLPPVPLGAARPRRPAPAAAAAARRGGRLGRLRAAGRRARRRTRATRAGASGEHHRARAVAHGVLPQQAPGLVAHLEKKREPKTQEGSAQLHGLIPQACRTSTWQVRMTSP